MAIKNYYTKTHEDWLNLRKSFLGGSDSAAVVGLNPYSSPYSVWAEKTGRIPGFGGNLATEAGTFLEEFVAEKFCEQTGKKVRRNNASMVNDQYPWAIANVDRVVVGEDAGLECKTTSELLTSKFKNGDFPSQYYVQCMHYLAVTGKARWYLAVLIGNRDFKVFTIERDEAEIKALMTAEQEFWDHVKKDTEPPMDGSKSTSDTLAYVYAANPDQECDLTPVSSYVRMYQELKVQEKDLKTQIEDAANHIKFHMKNASKGTFGEFKVTWKEQARTTLDKKKLQAAHPEIDLTPYSNTSVSRVFRFN